MASCVLNNKQVNKICQFTPESINYVDSYEPSSVQTGISKAASSVLSYMQTTDNELDMDRVHLFIKKIDMINAQFEERGLGTPFKSILFSISYLSNLRENLGAGYGDLIAAPFTLELVELSNQESIEDKLAVATKLHVYMKNTLIPALKNAQSQEEIFLLEPMVDQCLALCEKVESIVDADGPLSEVKSSMVEVYNAQLLKNGVVFKKIFNYQEGDFNSIQSSEKREKLLKGLDSFTDSFIKACETSVLTTEEKVKVYESLVKIEAAFAAIDDHSVGPLIEKLNEALNIPKGMRSATPIKLGAIQSTNKREIAQKLFVFQQNQLLPYLDNATQDQIESAKPLIELCKEVSTALASVDTKGLLKEQRLQIEFHLAAKECVERANFQKFLKVSPEMLGNLKEQERREKVLKHIDTLKDEVIKFKDHPLMTQEIKEQFFKAVQLVHLEFTKAGYGEELEPVIKELRCAFNYPEPKASSSKQGVSVHTKTDKPVSTSSVAKLRGIFSKSEEATPTTVKASVPKKEMSLEERKKTALVKIQGLISKLDPQSLTFKANLEAILLEIKLVKNKYPSGTTSHFDQLEKAIELLLDPQSIKVSEAEEQMIQRIAFKHGVSSIAAGEYKGKTQASSIHEAKKRIIKALKGEASSLEGLNEVASQAVKEARITTMRERFLMFAKTHNINPPLSRHFPTHFPRLVLMLESFSRTFAVKKIKGTWSEVQSLYNDGNSMNFSKVLSTYSYLDPESLIPQISKASQVAFLEGIDFNLVDGQETIDFKGYMKQVVQTHVGNLPSECFESAYKEYFGPRHRWLHQNLKYLKVPYNQGDQKDSNLGEGVCMSNSLNRIGILAANPDAPIEQITMGSTQKTRLLQTKTKHYYLAAANGKETYAFANKKEVEQSKEFGIIAKSDELPIENRGSDIHQNLVNQMVIHARGGQKSFLVSLYRKGGGHAINVQIDPSRGVYRLMDDNIGLLEYPDEATFKRELGEYFRLNYSNYDEFAFTDFVKA